MESPFLINFPPELLRLVIEKLPLSDKLNIRAASRSLNAFVLSEVKSHTCELLSIAITQLKNNVHLAVEMTDHVSALHFVDLQAILTIQKRRTIRGKELLLNFRSFDSLPRDFALFDKAHISKFRVQKRMPYYLDSDNLRRLQQLLAGCTIDKMSLVVDSATTPQIPTIPALLALTRVKHAEFVLQNIDECDMQVCFRENSFISKLAETEVREISFIGDNVFGRRIGGYVETRTDFALIECLLNSGIRRINMQFDALERDGFERFQLRPFLRSLSLASHHVEIVLKNRIPIEQGTKVYRMAKKYPRFLVTANKSGRNFTMDELLIATLKDDERPLIDSVDL